VFFVVSSLVATYCKSVLAEIEFLSLSLLVSVVIARVATLIILLS